MKPLPVLLMLALLVGCPKEKQPTTPDPAATVTWFAVFIADAEGATPPESVRVEASAGSGTLIFVEAPALLVDDPPEGWRRWTRIGDASARARLGNPAWLLSAGAAGAESSAVYLELSAEGAAETDIRETLQSAGVRVNTIAGNIVTASVPRGAWGALLKLTQVVAVEPADVVGKKQAP